MNREIQELLLLSRDRCPLSTLFFTVYYNDQLQKLSFYLERVVNLPTTLPEVSSKSYAQIYLLSSNQEDDICTSHLVRQTHQPRFDYMATFSHISEKDLDSQVVVFRIYLQGGYFLGGVVYPLELVKLYGSTVTAEVLTFPEQDSLKVILLVHSYKLNQKEQ